MPLIHFSLDETLHKLRHYLPAQAPLKDFVHHNTLHAFQNEKFEKAVRNASKIFGYKSSLSLGEYRELLNEGKIDRSILEKVIQQREGLVDQVKWYDRLLTKTYNEEISPKIGGIREAWKKNYAIDLDTIVHTNLFRILNAYLDQGIASSKFPVNDASFMASVRILERNTLVGFFKTKRAKRLLQTENLKIETLLEIIVGDPDFYEEYLFDQQFAHPGWSGLVAVIEQQPLSLLDGRKITLKELLILECLLEIDNLDYSLGKDWQPLSKKTKLNHLDLFDKNEFTEYDEVLTLWQKAYEWTYYDDVLSGIKSNIREESVEDSEVSFQAFFCIDDRECSIRRNIEHFDTTCHTYGTPGHFGVEAYYQPRRAKFHTKVCPGPVTPTHLLKEVATNKEDQEDIHFDKSTHSLLKGLLISQTIGFWSVIKLLINIFRPSFSPVSSSSLLHMDEFSSLTIENRSDEHMAGELRIGFTIDEMTDIVESVLRSTGLVSGFSRLIYIFGHGGSSANNTHYAGYDCGACSGRPGSANARAFSHMANHKGVRKGLKSRGILLDDETEFIGGLHDTTKDEFTFYDEELLSPENEKLHDKNKNTFHKALQANAKERSRRFNSVNTRTRDRLIHTQVKLRAVSLFEPRPELNHATNALCIIGSRRMIHNLFLDRRAFLNSYDYRLDPDGALLGTILNAAAPVCGGINLEYYFSRVDNEKLGAGSKLPHNAMGLIGVANGFEGDLRTGLPSQMIEVHDPIRLLMIIEHFPEAILKAIQNKPETYEWFINEWVMLCAVHPETKEIHRFADGKFEPYTVVGDEPETIQDLTYLIETSSENLPVYKLKPTANA